jgi:hypothetical protein
MDQGVAFMSGQFKEFTESLKIKLLNSSPYYVQANRQAEASNKVLIGLIKKKIEETPRRWYDVFNEALWACRVSKHDATKVTPFELVYRQEAVLPIEINLPSCRVRYQDQLGVEEYHSMMIDEIDDITKNHLEAL